MSKMGISTIRSYRGAKLFEAVGLSTALTDAYFGGTASSVGGIRLQEIAADAIALHHQAFGGTVDNLTLEHKGLYSFRKDGEKHAWNPETISALQQATRLGSYKEVQGIHTSRRRKGYTNLPPRFPDLPNGKIHSDRRCGTSKRDHEAFRHGRHELRLDQQRGARDDGNSNEQDTWTQQHWGRRRRLRPFHSPRRRSLPPFRHQTSGLRTFRRNR